jgi:hypothetical protein
MVLNQGEMLDLKLIAVCSICTLAEFRKKPVKCTYRYSVESVPMESISSWWVIEGSRRSLWAPRNPILTEKLLWGNLQHQRQSTNTKHIERGVTRTHGHQPAKSSSAGSLYEVYSYTWFYYSYVPIIVALTTMWYVQYGATTSPHYPQRIAQEPSQRRD